MTIASTGMQTKKVTFHAQAIGKASMMSKIFWHSHAYLSLEGKGVGAVEEGEEIEKCFVMKAAGWAIED